MEDLKVDPIFKKGFEHGYWLEKGKNPHLKSIVEKAQTDTEYYEGIVAGVKEASLERNLEKPKDRHVSNDSFNKSVDDRELDKGLKN